MSDNNVPNPDGGYPPPSNPYPNQPPPPPGPAQPPQSPYGAPSQPGNWPPPPTGIYNQVGQPYSPVNATMILILGILGLTICQICAPIAWVLGNQALRALDQFGDPLGQRGMVNGGRICGIIGTALIGAGIVAWVLAVAMGIGTAVLHPSS